MSSNIFIHSCESSSWDRIRRSAKRKGYSLSENLMDDKKNVEYIIDVAKQCNNYSRNPSAEYLREHPNIWSLYELIPMPWHQLELGLL